MRVFLLNLLLAISWSALTGDATLVNLLFGFLLGYLALRVSPELPGGSKYFKRLQNFFHLSIFFLQELILSSLRAAWEIFSPTLKSRPMIVRIPLEIHERNQIFVLINLISLTPGTMVLDISPDNSTLIVHTMFVDNPDSFRQGIRHGFEKRVKEAIS
ncbi:Na+/H+ antiporter subunit E [Microbulbifer sp. 2205BS26-8]|uniref:Na+/H+ antiporter subunit E n=1 Tax=Microbulbifer sp. 2205BS26-8 TaxID=3064386 RepID=UPI0027402641|nr:Na+/H+ antiporter subunit E [Microbulbifer sp. 2205BS26-8]MDP5209771.1 Na+/H+ antiporter subunit E [Microbulbifer sp. 2205BS26-8]